MDQLFQQYQSKVLFAFRNFPLYQIHPNAEVSAQAAEAAGIQGQYWQMHALLYKNQNDWASDTSGDVVTKYFDVYAQQLGLDVSKFNSDVNSTAVKGKVQADTVLGNQAQIDHTPTFFVNGVQIENPTSYADFRSVIDAALASSTASH
jgi:protein-disulfide isomerase